MNDGKAMQFQTAVLREHLADPAIFEGIAMTNREKAIWHDAFIAGQYDIQHRLFKVLPRNSVYHWRQEASQ